MLIKKPERQMLEYLKKEGFTLAITKGKQMHIDQAIEQASDTLTTMLDYYPGYNSHMVRTQEDPALGGWWDVWISEEVYQNHKRKMEQLAAEEEALEAKQQRNQNSNFIPDFPSALQFYSFARIMRYDLPDGQWDELKELAVNFAESYGKKAGDWPEAAKQSFTEEVRQNYLYWL
ncbi:MAG: hypothetical protein ACOYJ1_05535 [Peptococcales bacterium]|jgi:hypothetical protein